MAYFGRPPKQPDGTEGYASITLTLEEPDCEIKTIACIIKNDEQLQELQRENRSDLYVKTHKKTKFFLYFYCSQSNLSRRLVKTEIVVHRFNKPKKDKNCIIKDEWETRPFFLRNNHVFLPACHKVFKTNQFEIFLTNCSRAVTLKNLSAGKHRGVQNKNAPVEYLSFSLSSSNNTFNIPNPAYKVFQNLVDGPLLLFEEASWRLIGWYKKAPEGDRITVYNLIAQDTTVIWKTSSNNQPYGSPSNQYPADTSGSADQPTSTDQPNPFGSDTEVQSPNNVPGNQTDGSQHPPDPSVSADPPTSTDQSNQSGSDTGVQSPNNVQDPVLQNQPTQNGMQYQPPSGSNVGLSPLGVIEQQGLPIIYELQSGFNRASSVANQSEAWMPHHTPSVSTVGFSSDGVIRQQVANQPEAWMPHHSPSVSTVGSSFSFGHQDNALAKDEFKSQSPLMDELSGLLDKDGPMKNWRKPEYNLGIPEPIYQDFIMTRMFNANPNDLLTEWLSANKPDFTVGMMVECLQSIGRNDVVQDPLPANQPVGNQPEARMSHHPPSVSTVGLPSDGVIGQQVTNPLANQPEARMPHHPQSGSNAGVSSDGANGQQLVADPLPVNQSVATSLQDQPASDSNVVLSSDGANGQQAHNKDKGNYNKLCNLLMDTGRQVLQDVFDKIHPPSTLIRVISSNNKTLNMLRSKNLLYGKQWDTLFPTSGAVTSADFDITLLFLLLRTICNLKAPEAGWDKPPLVSDFSKEADLLRIKRWRNELAHNSNTAIPDKTFDTLWIDIVKALLRLKEGI